MKCITCTADIDADSCYCDQCGAEILVCSICAQPGSQKFCEVDGGDLVPAKSKQAALNLNSTRTVPPIISAPPSKLTLTNINLNITINVQPNAILGRNTGPYISFLQNYSAISGKHLVFKYDDSKGWSFEDMGSTNGTKYSVTNLHWDQEKKCQPNQPVYVTDRAYLLVANIEMLIETDFKHSESTTLPAATQRI